jgi:hypothetical protein
MHGRHQPKDDGDKQEGGHHMTRCGGLGRPEFDRLFGIGDAAAIQEFVSFFHRHL